MKKSNKKQAVSTSTEMTDHHPQCPDHRHHTFIPPADKETFKDLLVFEERLKQNAARLQAQRVKYEAFLFSMVILTIVLGYKTTLSQSPYQIIHYIYLGLLLVSITTLILFFATGMYTDRIVYAYKFIPQTNRALRPFNLFLNTPPPSSWVIDWFKWFRKSPSKAKSYHQMNSVTSPPQPSRSSASFAATTANSSVFPPTLINPRGELLFSSRVSSEFVDKYEIYRTQWERRQKKLT